ncbi:phage tail assembly chaperone [Stappia albiluteola]|nr:phage tail assembly chaperone [Stappia albiluteola]
MPALGWRPSDFWSASLVEFFVAIEGHAEMNGADKASDGVDPDEYEALKRRYG